MDDFASSTASRRHQCGWHYPTSSLLQRLFPPPSRGLLVLPSCRTSLLLVSSVLNCTAQHYCSAHGCSLRTDTRRRIANSITTTIHRHSICNHGSTQCHLFDFWWEGLPIFDSSLPQTWSQNCCFGKSSSAHPRESRM